MVYGTGEKQWGAFSRKRVKRGSSGRSIIPAQTNALKEAENCFATGWLNCTACTCYRLSPWCLG